MTHRRGHTAAWLIVGWALMCLSAGAPAHQTTEEEYNNLGGCVSFGISIAESVWMWCANNRRDAMNECKASHRSWVEEVAGTCTQARQLAGCSSDVYDAVEWHSHGEGSGEQLRVHNAVNPSDGTAPPDCHTVLGALVVDGWMMLDNSLAHAPPRNSTVSGDRPELGFSGARDE